jgi:hypothetical protein
MTDTDLTQPVLVALPPAQIRNELERLFLKNIVGPEGGEEEELDIKTVRSVSDYYLVGMLAPMKRMIEMDDKDDLAIDGAGSAEGQSPDISAPTARSLLPSSVGMTFGVANNQGAIMLDAHWGRYEKATLEIDDEEGKGRRVWSRFPMGGSVSLSLTDGDFEGLVPDPAQPEVIIRGRVRHNGGDWMVTAFLVNTQEEEGKRRDEAWLLQVQLGACAADGSSAVFRRPSADGDPVAEGSEAAALAMAYRDHVEFAVGHGTGVHATRSTKDPTQAVRVETTAVPSYEVPRTDPPSPTDFPDVPQLGDVELDMAQLAVLEQDALLERLRPLVTAYRTWIGLERARIGDPVARLGGFEQTAADALAGCAHAADRIEAGIDLLATEPLAAEAFRFANRAMWQQRVHTLAAEARRKDPNLSLAEAVDDADEPRNRSWRLFQLAFVLLNLPSLFNPNHDERKPGREGLADLLWFPTGGGKTEAYLGLSAFTMAIRRLQGVVGGYDGSDGVAVFMRYTLRLLTVQQFQRAAALMCACEQIRRDSFAGDDKRWGEVPFRLGLWVGFTVTPSNEKQAQVAIEEERGGGWGSGNASAVKVTSCPWCGSEITARRDADPDTVRARTLVYCSDPLGRCPFTRRNAPDEGLPLITVDTEIYRLVPAMVIATADKFAQVPWRGPTRALFGRVTRRCERHGYRHPDLDIEMKEANSHPRRGAALAAKTVDVLPLRPPDLIIQDELHLIAGPLGSLMGLYETAIDHLCTWELHSQPVRPKVVASTATVRRAEEQAFQVFWRRLEVFPPPGLDAGDSFFALQRDPSQAAGRRYLGVCAPGRRIKVVEIRLYVALMGAAQKLFETYGEAVDPWMTMVGYFSALRELAGMSRLVRDDVATRLSTKAIRNRGLGWRFIRDSRELTSRIDSSEIPEILDRLSIMFPKDHADPDREKKRKERGDQSKRPIDVLLATNMISVGVDVPRLGLMVVGGQPKSTAEYIQATSRVGRSASGPGLVVTALNWARPRDLSHFETFEHFHATFYQHVEALSVTPFAPRSLDRGLSAVLASLVRQQDDAANANAAPQMLDPQDAIEPFIGLIRTRAEDLTSDASVGEAIDQDIKIRADAWLHQKGRAGEVLGYRQKQDGKTVGLLHQPSEGAWGLWTCPTSLREVEPGVNLLLTDFVADEELPFEFPSREPSDAALEDDAVPPLSEDEVDAARATPPLARPS